MTILHKRLWCTLFFFSTSIQILIANTRVKLPYFFSNNMVLQRDKPIKFWGTAKPNSVFEVIFVATKKSVTVDDKGNWETTFKPMPAGGPYQLTIHSDSSFSFNNIMMGDIWFCSGQSNMEWQMQKVLNASVEIRNAHFPYIRTYNVPQAISITTMSNTKKSEWLVCNTENAGNFSSVAYFFAKQLYAKTKIPIGIINASWGGTMVEAWTSIDGVAKLADCKIIADSLRAVIAEGRDLEGPKNEYEAKWNFYEQEISRTDPGFFQKWYLPNQNNTGWGKMTVPGAWSQTNLFGFRGSVWVKKMVYIPKNLTHKKLSLNLEVLDQTDITYFNGKQIGRTFWSPGRRKYIVPAELVREGKNEIVIRLESLDKDGGFKSYYDGDIRLDEFVSSDTPLSVPLYGEWLIRKGLPLNLYPLKEPKELNQQHIPTVIYNAMVAPFISIGLKGFIWYQGESNTERGYQYRYSFREMISDWRKQFNQGDLPFIFTQLAGFGRLTDAPSESKWAELRESQSATLSLPNTGMAVTIDAGIPFDIHPVNKQIVAIRLSLEAFRLAYGDSTIKSSPQYQSMQTESDSIKLVFSNMDNGIIYNGSEPSGFAIAGEDKKFVWAKAKIFNQQIIVWSPEIKNPVAVRYAWADSPVESNDSNIYNLAQLPLAPFRTDSWQTITENKKYFINITPIISKK